MATEVKVLTTIQDSGKKPIQFFRYMFEERFIIGKRKPSEYKNIELICKNYGSAAPFAANSVPCDLMFAYNEDRNKGIVYLGRFNDGIV